MATPSYLERRRFESEEQHRARLERVRQRAAEEGRRSRAASDRRSAKEARLQELHGNREALVKDVVTRVTAFLKAELASGEGPLAGLFKFVVGPGERAPAAKGERSGNFLVVERGEWKASLDKRLPDSVIVRLSVNGQHEESLKRYASDGGPIAMCLRSKRAKAAGAFGAHIWSGGAGNTFTYGEDLSVRPNVNGSRSIVLMGGSAWHACTFDVSAGANAEVPAPLPKEEAPVAKVAFNIPGLGWVESGSVEFVNRPV